MIYCAYSEVLLLVDLAISHREIYAKQGLMISLQNYIIFRDIFTTRNCVWLWLYICTRRRSLKICWIRRVYRKRDTVYAFECKPYLYYRISVLWTRWRTITNAVYIYIRNRWKAVWMQLWVFRGHIGPMWDTCMTIKKQMIKNHIYFGYKILEQYNILSQCVHITHLSYLKFSKLYSLSHKISFFSDEIYICLNQTI